MNARGYLDYNGSTPVHPEVAAALLAYFEQGFGNAAAAHPEGRRAAAAIAEARGRIAAGLGARAEEVWFTSGGTESNNWALTGVLRAAGGPAGRHLVVTGIEHKSVLQTARDLAAQGARLTVVDARRDGAVRAEDVAAALEDDTALVSVMLANNETGVLQPVREIAALCRASGVPLHCDAVAAIGKVPVPVGGPEALGVDLLSLSSHKLYAPKGCGVLWVRAGLALHPLIHGCGQQDAMRSGSENTPGAVAFGQAFELLARGALGRPEAIAELRDSLWRGIAAVAPDALRHGAPGVAGEGPCALPNTLSVAFPGHASAALQRAFGEQGISLAAGAAASTGEPSHVLTSMGIEPDVARSTLRFSLGAHTTAEDVERTLVALRSILASPARV